MQSEAGAGQDPPADGQGGLVLFGTGQPMLDIEADGSYNRTLPDAPLSGRGHRDAPRGRAGGLSPCSPPAGPTLRLPERNTVKHDDLKALARSRRETELADLRDGRVRRATRIESAKRYRRRPKHQREE